MPAAIGQWSARLANIRPAMVRQCGSLRLRFYLIPTSTPTAERFATGFSEHERNQPWPTNSPRASVASANDQYNPAVDIAANTRAPLAGNRWGSRLDRLPPGSLLLLRLTQPVPPHAPRCDERRSSNAEASVSPRYIESSYSRRARPLPFGGLTFLPDGECSNLGTYLV